MNASTCATRAGSEGYHTNTAISNEERVDKHHLLHTCLSRLADPESTPYPHALSVSVRRARNVRHLPSEPADCSRVCLRFLFFLCATARGASGAGSPLTKRCIMQCQQPLLTPPDLSPLWMQSKIPRLAWAFAMAFSSASASAALMKACSCRKVVL